MADKVCPKCNSSDIDSDGARGEAVCTNCGHVLEQCAIVSEVQFSENAGGQSSVVGQFVPENGISYHRGPGFAHGFGKDSREQTLTAGKKWITTMANTMQLVQDHVDVANRFFQQAVHKNFLQGRKMHNVGAVCLYITCRFRKTSHMLIDFAENLQIDVHELGAVFLKFSRTLNIHLEPIDPSLYIHRFAAQLEFGDKTNAVATTAIRVVANMNREWMTTGRRPAGICGAGLLIAAKMHRFHRTEAQVAQVVRICDGTLKKRLNEFDETSASEMTVPQFNALFKTGSVSDFVDANAAKKEQENWAFTNVRQPPALKQQEKKRKQREEAAQRGAEDGEPELQDCVGLEELGNQASKILQSSKAFRELDHNHEAGAQITAAAKKKEAQLKEAAAVKANEQGHGNVGSSSSKGQDGPAENGVGTVDGRHEEEGVSRAGALGESNESSASRVKDLGQSVAASPGAVRPVAAGKVAVRAMSIREQGEWAEDDDEDDMTRVARREEEEAEESAAAVAREENERLSDVDDDEINACIRTQEEADQRKTVWEELNSEYIARQAEKQKVEDMKESIGIQQQDKQVKRKRRVQDNSVSHTAHESVSKMIRNRNLSNKVNYDALEELFGGD